MFNQGMGMRRVLLGYIMALAIVAMGPAQGQAQPTPSAYGVWDVSDQASPLDGTPNFKAAVIAENTVGADRGRQKKPGIGLFCDHDGFTLQINWPTQIDADSRYMDSVPLIWKLDDGPLKKTYLGFGKKVLFANGGRGLSLVGQWAVGKVLVVRVPDRQGGQDTTFHIDGLDGVMAHIQRTGCGPSARAR